MQALHEALIAQADHLANLATGKPRRADLRRAASTAYYALFHFLIDEATKRIIGTQHDRRPFRLALARGFDHSGMRKACASFAGGNLPSSLARPLGGNPGIPDELKRFARTFVRLQEKRHLADYDLSTSFTKSEVTGVILQAQQALALFAVIKDEVVTWFFLTCLLAWENMARRSS